MGKSTRRSTSSSSAPLTQGSSSATCGRSAPGAAAMPRGYGKSSLLQYTVEHDQRGLRRVVHARRGPRPGRCRASRRCAQCSPRSTWRPCAVCTPSSSRRPSHACPLQGRRQPDASRRVYLRLCEQLQYRRPGEAPSAVLGTYDAIVGRTLGPPQEDFLARLCTGDERAIREQINSVQPGCRYGAGNCGELLCDATPVREDRGDQARPPRLRPARGLRRHDHREAEARAGDRAVSRLRAGDPADGRHARPSS